MQLKTINKTLALAKLALLALIALNTTSAFAAPDCDGAHSGAPVCGGGGGGNQPCGWVCPIGSPCRFYEDTGQSSCNLDPPPAQGDGGGSSGGGSGGGGGGSTPTPTATPEPEQTWPGVSTGDFSSVPPNLTGHMNAVDGEREIENALDLFGADGLIVNGMAATDGGKNVSNDGTDTRNANTRNGGGGGNGSTTLAASGSDKASEGFVPGTTQASGGQGVGTGFSADISVNAADAEDAQKDKAATNYASFSKGDGYDAGGVGGSGGRGLAGAGGTGEVGADGPAGATRGRSLAGANGDEYLSRAGKLSLFEIINRRYEIWGSQIMRK